MSGRSFRALVAPRFREVPHLTATQTALLVAVPVVLGSLARIPMGILTDVFGGRLVFAVLMIVSAVPAFLIPLANSYAMLLSQPCADACPGERAVRAKRCCSGWRDDLIMSPMSWRKTLPFHALLLLWFFATDGLAQNAPDPPAPLKTGDITVTGSLRSRGDGLLCLTHLVGNRDWPPPPADATRQVGQQSRGRLFLPFCIHKYFDGQRQFKRDCLRRLAHRFATLLKAKLA